ncbi:UbiD family decarboxylase [Candidatus Bathyarchaeota archaeon]|nr:MAG: UbiD family decarboxylase [Candidatus Bathyarchaeota archaeon]
MVDLREFLNQLETENELIKIEEEVSTKFEMAANIKKLEAEKAVFFKKVKESNFSVVAAVCGNRKRICKALNVIPEKLYEKILQALKFPKKPSMAGDGKVKEVWEKPNLKNFPILTHYEKDAGPYITSAIISAKSPDGKIENVSIHRLLVLRKDKLAIRIVPRHLQKLCEMAKESGKKTLDIAVCIGVHPAIFLAAASPAPFGLSEYEVANSLLDGKLKLLDCENVDVRVPSDAEIVFEGKILLDEKVSEGPFTDVTQTYDIVRLQPTIKLVGIMRRKNCIYQALLPGGTEHRLFMGLAREAKIWETVKAVVPTVKAVRLTDDGCGWLHAVVSIKKQLEGDGKNVVFAAFTAHPSLKHVVVVDEDINVENPLEVEWAIATRFQADKGLIKIENVRGSTLDPSANQETGTTTKLGLDATKPLSKPPEKFEKAKIPENRKVKDILEKLGLG